MQRIPRAGWLAIGALAAALLLGDAGLLALVAAAIALSAAVVLALAHRRSAAALVLAFGTVALRAGLVAMLAGPGSPALALVTGSAEWDGTVTDVSAPKGPDQRAFITLEPTAGPGSWLVYAWLPRHPTLVTGDRIHVRGVVDGPPADAPGFADFLESRGAVGTLKAHALELRGHGRGLGPTVEQLRWGVDGALGRAIPEPEAGLASGILIGLRERVSEAVADDFTVTGLTHVVAISGWNIALVAGIATALLRATGLRRRWRSAIVLAAIVAYTVFAGADASVVRAAVMGGVVLIAREGGRPSGAAAALGLACWGLLLADPGMVEDIGLQLSMAATAGLLALGGPAERAVRRACRDQGPRWLSESLGVSLAAQLSTLPLVLFHFGRLSLISPLANLLVAPVVPLAMLGAVIGVLVAPLLAVGPLSLLLAPLLLAAWLPLVLMTRGASLLARVPLANLELAAPLDVVGALVALAALVAVLRRTGRTRGRPELTPLAPTRTRTATPTAHRGRRRLVAAGLSLTLVATVSVALVAGPAASPSCQRPRRRPGRRHPAGGKRRRADARRRRPRSRRPGAATRRAHPDLGPTDRHSTPDASARGPCRWARRIGATLPGRTSGRDGHAHRGCRCAGAAGGLGPPVHPPLARAARRSPATGSGGDRGRMAAPGAAARPAPVRWTCHQRHLHRARGPRR